MNDLINRQDAINAIHTDILFKPLDNGTFYRESNEFVPIGYVERILLALPSAQPEQTMGKWIDAYYSFLDGCRVWHRICSVCGYERDDDNPDKDTNYCPNCGSHMENGGEDD